MTGFHAPAEGVSWLDQLLNRQLLTWPDAGDNPSDDGSPQFERAKGMKRECGEV
jgi:hypothetical protein